MVSLRHFSVSIVCIQPFCIFVSTMFFIREAFHLTGQIAVKCFVKCTAMKKRCSIVDNKRSSPANSGSQPSCWHTKNEIINSWEEICSREVWGGKMRILSYYFMISIYAQVLVSGLLRYVNGFQKIGLHLKKRGLYLQFGLKIHHVWF